MHIQNSTPDITRPADTVFIASFFIYCIIDMEFLTTDKRQVHYEKMEVIKQNDIHQAGDYRIHYFTKSLILAQPDILGLVYCQCYADLDPYI